MNQDFKYLIFDGTTGFDGFIFPPYEKHDEVARRFNWSVLSAGFIKISRDKDTNKIEIQCYGKSVSLGVGSQKGDEAAFKKLID